MDSFVYEWINKENNKRYIGKHTGGINDGYIASGKEFLIEYKKEPSKFYRDILWQGSKDYVFSMESFYIKLRVDQYGVDMVYNLIGIKRPINYDYLVENRMLNFIRCLHCDEICIKSESNQIEVELFESLHFEYCKNNTYVKKKTYNVRPQTACTYCEKLQRKINKIFMRDPKSFLVEKYKQFFKDRCS